MLSWCQRMLKKIIKKLATRWSHVLGPILIDYLTSTYLMIWKIQNQKTKERSVTSTSKTLELLQDKLSSFLQVNIFQKPSFLHQLIHNMTRDCSLNYKENTSSEHVVYKYCFECQNKNKKQFFYTTCSDLVFFL